MRGNPYLGGAIDIGLRSIPARAGEPWGSCPSGRFRAVYPRACGGTINASRISRSQSGLSPRVRGNRCGTYSRGTIIGSIPARAGEPTSSCRPTAAGGVYPRACGGTTTGMGAACCGTGLSPRVRGNLRQRVRFTGIVGSIPARAGEPCAETIRPSVPAVYPRACGGTIVVRDRELDELGLSPRVRGNLAVQPFRAGPGGSIPARAGEPSPRWRRRPRAWVYPRACGGTPLAKWAMAFYLGLSPRVRGNRAHALAGKLLDGSIPARAGEPNPSSLRRRRPTVYPRACGGTHPVDHVRGEQGGLSPRVRGNLTTILPLTT